MINQLKKLEHRRDTSCLCLLFKILHHQVHVPTYDIPVPAPITATISSHKRNFISAIYARTDVYTNSFFPCMHTWFYFEINYQKQLRKLNYWILLNLHGIYNFIRIKHALTNLTIPPVHSLHLW